MDFVRKPKENETIASDNELMAAVKNCDRLRVWPILWDHGMAFKNCIIVFYFDGNPSKKIIELKLPGNMYKKEALTYIEPITKNMYREKDSQIHEFFKNR